MTTENGYTKETYLEKAILIAGSRKTSKKSLIFSVAEMRKYLGNSGVDGLHLADVLVNKYPSDKHFTISEIMAIGGIEGIDAAIHCLQYTAEAHIRRIALVMLLSRAP